MRIGVPFTVATMMWLNASGGVDAPQRPQQDLRLALLDDAARHLDVLGGDRLADVLDREPVAVQLLDVDDDVDLAGAAAAEVDLADAVDRLDAALHLLVGELRERPEAHRVRRQHDRHDRIRVGIHLLDDRRQHLRRQVAHRPGNLLTDVVGGVVDVALEHEAEGDGGAAFADALRQHLVDAGDAAQRLLERLDHGRRHLGGAGPRQLHADGDRRGIGLREEVDAEVAEGEDAQHHQRHDEHGGEDGPADAQLGK